MSPFPHQWNLFMDDTELYIIQRLCCVVCLLNDAGSFNWMNTITIHTIHADLFYAVGLVHSMKSLFVSYYIKPTRKKKKEDELDRRNVCNWRRYNSLLSLEQTKFWWSLLFVSFFFWFRVSLSLFLSVFELLQFQIKFNWSFFQIIYSLAHFE